MKPHVRQVGDPLNEHGYGWGGTTRRRGGFRASVPRVTTSTPPNDARPCALITGGGGGVGRAVAARFVAAGWRVALIGRDAARLEDAAAGCGPLASAHRADVTRRDEVDAVVTRLIDAGSPPRALVHAAGVARSAPLLPPDDALWADTFAVNATGAWIAATACVPALVAAGGGDLAFVGSTAALRGYRYTAAYVASKHAVLGLARALAADLRPRGVRVHVVCPGFLDTPMTDATIARLVATTKLDEAAARASLAAMNASGRLIDPADVADRIVDRILGRVDDPEPVVIE